MSNIVFIVKISAPPLESPTAPDFFPTGIYLQTPDYRRPRVSSIDTVDNIAGPESLSLEPDGSDDERPTRKPSQTTDPDKEVNPDGRDDVPTSSNPRNYIIPAPERGVVRKSRTLPQVQCHVPKGYASPNLTASLPLPGSSPGSFKCEYPGCNTAPFQTEYLLNSHVNVHCRNRPHYCPVPGSPRGEGGKGFKRKNEMIRHGLVHESYGYVCPFCPDREQKYPRPENLQRHVRVIHIDKDRDDPLLREVLAQGPELRNRGRGRRIVIPPEIASGNVTAAGTNSDREAKHQAEFATRQVHATTGSISSPTTAAGIPPHRGSASHYKDKAKPFDDYDTPSRIFADPADPARTYQTDALEDLLAKPNDLFDLFEELGHPSEKLEDSDGH